MYGFVGIFAKELSSDNIRVNAIGPGNIKTDFMKVVNPTELAIKTLKKSNPFRNRRCHIISLE